MSSQDCRQLALFCVLLLIGGCSGPGPTIAPRVTNETWTCYGNGGQWHCIAGHRVPPPPGAVDLGPEPGPASGSQTDTTGEMPPATPATSPDAATHGEDIAAGDTVIQLVAVQRREELAQYRRIYRQFDPQAYRRRIDGTTWYALLLGPFADRVAARARLAELPAQTSLPTPWVRRATTADSPLPPVADAGQ